MLANFGLMGLLPWLSATLVSCLGALTLLSRLILTLLPRFIFKRDRGPASPPVARTS